MPGAQVRRAEFWEASRTSLLGRDTPHRERSSLLVGGGLKERYDKVGGVYRRGRTHL